MIGGDALPQSPLVILTVLPETGPERTPAPERLTKFYPLESVQPR
jgi:hypothetical protein